MSMASTSLSRIHSCTSGCGYTVQTDVQLWMRDTLVEAIDIVPFGYADTLRGQAETEENEAYE